MARRRRLTPCAQRRGAELPWAPSAAATPSPDQEAFGQGGEWVDTRSAQSTPEPTHQFSVGSGAGPVDRLGRPITTPSPSGTPGGFVGPQWYMGGAGPRFHQHCAGGAGPGMPCSGPPCFSAQGGVTSQDCSGYAPLGVLPPAMWPEGAQLGRPTFGMPGAFALQAANPQDAHHWEHSYQAAACQLGAMGCGVFLWRPPGCPLLPAFVGPPQASSEPPAQSAPQSAVSSPPMSMASGVPAPCSQGGNVDDSGCLRSSESSDATATALPRAARTGAGRRRANDDGNSNAADDDDDEDDCRDVRGQVAQLSRTQAGSKFLQRQLQRGGQGGQGGAVDLILREVEEDVPHLMCDAYGNYLCSVAFQACSVLQRMRMLERVAPTIATIACDKRGTHALQALIGLLSTDEEQRLLMSAASAHVIKLCMDPNGTHVVQRVLFCFKPHLTEWIYVPVAKNLVEVAYHPYGLCVLKKCITQAKFVNHYRDMLLAPIARNALDLVQSPYGNYAVQHALDEWGGPCCTPIFQSLQGQIARLSIQKFSSNVVEKLFSAAPCEFRGKFIAELAEPDSMAVVVNSNYGHYVVKRALETSGPMQVHALLEAIRGSLGQLPNRRLKAKWEKVISAGRERLDDSGMRQPAVGVRLDASGFEAWGPGRPKGA